MTGKGKPVLDPASPLKVLLIRLRRTGDIILTTPAVAALKRQFPEYSLTYVVERPYARLMEGHPDLDRLIVLEPKSSWSQSLGLIRRVRRERYDAVVDFHGGPRSSLLTYLSGAGTKVGYRIRGRGWPYDVAISRRGESGPVHSVVNHVNLVRALGVADPDIPALSLAPARDDEILRVRRFFKANALDKAKPVVVHVGAGNRFRDWGADNLAELVNGLARTPRVRVILAGGEGDCGRDSEVRSKVSASVLSVVGSMNLIELREVISRSVLFVGPDSGPMHLAASTPTPIVALFGPNLPAYFAPWMAKATLLEKSLDCRPCKQRECVTQDFRCLRTISADDVLAACLPYLKNWD